MKKKSIEHIIRTYIKIKYLARKAFERDDYESSLKYISAGADLAYNFNWIYTDSDFEKMLSEIADKTIIKKNYAPKKNRIVFYDVYAIDNRGLTQQYIRGLMNWGVELLFVFEGDSLSNSPNIIKELSLYPKAQFFMVDSKLSQLEKLKLLYNKILDFKPEKAFLHLKPSSALAVCLWNLLPQTTRYLINITDHAFWLGKSCTDFSLEFRNYGYSVSLEKRGFNKKQLLIQPFYPITDCEPFIGMPEQVTSENIIILTGGAFYKMYGENDTFFEIMRRILEIDSKVVILIAGGGNAKPLNDFILKNSFKDRIILIGNRRDINQVFEKCDIYLSTYPLTGGLMGQLAGVNSKPILSYTSSDFKINFTEGFLNWGETNDWQVTHTKIDSFIQEAKKLIAEPNYRMERGKEAKNHVITPIEFNYHLKELITSNNNRITPEIENIDYEKIKKRYLDIENNYLFNFNALILSHLKFSTLIYFPLIVFNAVLSINIMNRVLKKIRFFIINL